MSSARGGSIKVTSDHISTEMKANKLLIDVLENAMNRKGLYLASYNTLVGTCEVTIETLASLLHVELPEEDS